MFTLSALDFDFCMYLVAPLVYRSAKATTNRFMVDDAVRYLLGDIEQYGDDASCGVLLHLLGDVALHDVGDAVVQAQPDAEVGGVFHLHLLATGEGAHGHDARESPGLYACPEDVGHGVGAVGQCHGVFGHDGYHTVLGERHGCGVCLAGEEVDACGESVGGDAGVVGDDGVALVGAVVLEYYLVEVYIGIGLQLGLHLAYVADGSVFVALYDVVVGVVGDVEVFHECAEELVGLVVSELAAGVLGARVGACGEVEGGEVAVVAAVLLTVGEVYPLGVVVVEEYVVVVERGELYASARAADVPVVVPACPLQVVAELVGDGVHTSRLGVSHGAVLGLVPGVLPVDTPVGSPEHLEAQVVLCGGDADITVLGQVERLALATGDEGRGHEGYEQQGGDMSGMTGHGL